MIPVVLNGVNMSTIAPPHSYINARDFPSAKLLADYIRRVDSDPKLFASYFWWRDHYTFDTDCQRGSGLCQLCDLLHSTDRMPRTVDLDNVLSVQKCDIVHCSDGICSEGIDLEGIDLEA